MSPEIYLKRPAHSDDWRLDIMLKKKAVRRVAGGRGGAWRWVRREKERKLKLQGRKHVYRGLLSGKHHLLFFLKRNLHLPLHAPPLPGADFSPSTHYALWRYLGVYVSAFLMGMTSLASV